MQSKIPLLVEATTLEVCWALFWWCLRVCRDLHKLLVPCSGIFTDPRNLLRDHPNMSLHSDFKLFKACTSSWVMIWSVTWSLNPLAMPKRSLFFFFLHSVNIFSSSLFLISLVDSSIQSIVLTFVCFALLLRIIPTLHSDMNFIFFHFLKKLAYFLIYPFISSVNAYPCLCANYYSHWFRYFASRWNS